MRDAGYRIFRVNDLYGRKILEWSVENSKPGIYELFRDFSDLTPGVYLIGTNENNARKMVIY